MSSRNRSGMIGKNIPKLLLKAIGNDPKRLQKVLDKFKEIRKQPKIPGLMSGGGAGLFSFRKKKTDKEEDSKENIIKKNVNKKQKRLEELKKQIKEQNKGGMMKYNKGGDAKIKKVIKGLHKASALHKGQAKSLESVVKKSTGGMADYYKDII